MPDLISYTAVIGRASFLPVAQRVPTRDPDGECLVRHRYVKEIKDEKRGLTVPVDDCTVFTVTHFGCNNSLATPIEAESLLEQALQAISDVAIWTKTKESVGRASAFMRQVGRLDVKFFFVEKPCGELVCATNPLFEMNHDALSAMSQVLPNFVMANGVASRPTHPIVRRVMSSLDLLNLGFYTEAFVTLFSLVDDLTQEVIRAGMTQKGVDAKVQEDMLRAIKERRLEHFLTGVAVLCGWKSMKEAKPEEFKRLLKANTSRNDILHGSARLGRVDTISKIDALLDTIDWLAANPFGYVVPKLPELFAASLDFNIFRKPPGEPTVASDVTPSSSNS